MAITVESLARVPDCAIMAAPRLPGRVACPACSTCPNRYTVSQRNKLKANADGSVDLYVQNQSPGRDKEQNWLPAPKDQFIL